jgi:hypothetical protein
MFWKGFILTAAISISLIGTSSVAFAACTNIPCRCAVQNGGSYNPATNRWSMHGCTGAQFQAFNDCVGRLAYNKRHPSNAGTVAVQPQYMSIRDSIQRQR